MVDHARQLARGAEQMGVALSDSQSAQLLDYMALLNKWNKAYNLTAVRNPDEMVSRHLLDSLSVLPFVEAGRWLDVGSGGGMPGVILAIMLPDNEFTLLDSNGKKTRFLTQVKLELGLDNMQVVNSRVEAFSPDQPFDGIVSRGIQLAGRFHQSDPASEYRSDPLAGDEGSVSGRRTSGTGRGFHCAAQCRVVGAWQ